MSAVIRFPRLPERTSNGVGMIVLAALGYAANPDNFPAYKRNAVSVLVPGTEQEDEYKREVETLFRALKPAHMVALLGQAEIEETAPEPPPDFPAEGQPGRVRQMCQTIGCGSESFEINYDPLAMGVDVSCSYCHRVVIL